MLSWKLFGQESFELVIVVIFAQGLLQLGFEFIHFERVAVVEVDVLENLFAPKVDGRLLVLDDLHELVRVKVAQQRLLGINFVDAVLQTVRAQDQHGDDDADQAPHDQRDGVHPDGRLVRVLVGQVRDDLAAERAQERAQEVRVGVAVAREHVGVLSPRAQLEDLVQLRGAKEQSRVVHKAEDQHRDRAHCDAGGALVKRVEPAIDVGVVGAIAPVVDVV